MAQLDVPYTSLVHYLLELMLVLVGNLHHHAGVLGQENLHDVVTAELVHVHFHSAFGVGKAHFQQRGNQSTGRDIVSGQNQPVVHQLLHGIERVAEIFGILAGRHVGTDLIQ